MSLYPVLGHQGGWDELLFVGGPVVAFAILLWLANRRARHLTDQAADSDSDSDADSDADGVAGLSD